MAYRKPHPLSVCGVPLGLWWDTLHSDEANASLRNESAAKWVRRTFGEQEFCEPEEWRNYLSGDRNPLVVPGGRDPLDLKWRKWREHSDPLAFRGRKTSNVP